MCSPLTDMVSLKVSCLFVNCVVRNRQRRDLLGIIGSRVVHSRGKGRNLVFLICVGLNCMLKLDNITLIHLVAKGTVEEFRWRRGRNVLWCVEDGGLGVCSSNVHRLVQSLSQPLKCNSLTPHEAPELAKL